MSSRVKSAYRNLLRAGQGFADYNMREYIVRRTKQDFRKYRGLNGAAAVAALQVASDTLALVRRQASISNSFAADEPLVMASVVAGKKPRAGSPSAPADGTVAEKTGAGGDPEEM